MHRPSSVVVAVLTSVCLYGAAVPGEEKPVAPPAVTASYAPNRVEALLTDGTDFMTLWSEATPGRDGLYATVVRDSGVTAPPAAVPLVRGQVFTTRAVWTGDAYLVMTVIDAVPLVLRLDREGRLLSGPAPSALGEWVSGFAWNGTYALATTWDFEAKRSTATMVDASGRVVRGGITLPHPANYHSAVGVDGAFVVFTSSQDEAGVTTVEAVRVTNGGAVSEPLRILQQQAHVMNDFAANGNEVGIALHTEWVTTERLHRFTLDPASMSLETLPVVELPPFTDRIAIVASPEGFTVSWGYVVSANAASFLGSIGFDDAAPRTLLVPEQMSGHHLETNGRSTLALWNHAPVRGATFDPAVRQRTSGVFPVTLAGVKQHLASMAAAPSSTLVAWIEDSGFDRGDVLVRRFDQAGNPLGAPLRIGASAWARGGNTAVTFTGRAWLVAWQAGDSAFNMRIIGRRLALDGTPIDAQPFELARGWYPTLASNGTVTLLGLTTEQHKAMAVLRFSPDGGKLDAQPVEVFADRGYSPAIATNGRELLMVWEASPVRSNNPSGIIGVRFDESGALLDPTPILITTSSLTEFQPHVASDGTDFLVAYTRAGRFVDSPTPPPAPLLHAKRVLRTGVLADTTAADTGREVSTGSEARVAPLGSGYVITFARGAAAVSLHALRVDANGAPIDGVRDLPTGESYTSEHALVRAGSTVLLAYPRLEPSLANAQRLYLRTLADDPPSRRRAVRR